MAVLLRRQQLADKLPPPMCHRKVALGGYETLVELSHPVEPVGYRPWVIGPRVIRGWPWDGPGSLTLGSPQLGPGRRLLPFSNAPDAIVALHSLDFAVSEPMAHGVPMHTPCPRRIADRKPNHPHPTQDRPRAARPGSCRRPRADARVTHTPRDRFIGDR